MSVAAAVTPYPWQQGLWQSVCRLAADGRLPHALLLAAPAGMGKRRFAQALAWWRLCQRPTADGACGQCRSCQLLQAGTHPDLLWVSPVVDGDKVSQVIKIEQARAVVDFATQSAQMQGHRVIVLTPADALNTAAANALLKTLEEPGRDTLFLLLTDRPAGLLATIRSRCQLLPMPQAELARLGDWLQGQGVPAAQLQTLWSLARGAPERVVSLAAAAWFQARADVLQALQGVAERRLAPLQAASGLAALAADDQAQAWHSLLDDAVLQQIDPDRAMANEDLAAGLRQLGARAGSQALLQALAAVVELRRLLGTNVQAQTLLEDLWLRWASLTRPA